MTEKFDVNINSWYSTIKVQITEYKENKINLLFKSLKFHERVTVQYWKFEVFLSPQ